MAIQWAYFPKSHAAPALARSVVEAFLAVAEDIDSTCHEHKSDEVLAIVRPGLGNLGFTVETGKKVSEKIRVPVLFGLNGQLEKYFEADAYHRKAGFVIEVEAGRAVANNQFLKDLFQACMMHDVRHLSVALRNTYKGSADFDRARVFFETLYASQRLQLPLEGVLLIGY